MSRLFLAYLLVLLYLSGCARMEIIPLKHDGTEDDAKQKGLRYYLPKPYLLVAEAPTETKPNQQANNDSIKSKQASTANKEKSDTANDKGKSDTPNSSPSSVSDTSFSLVTDKYVLKLVYLPDYSQPMAIDRPWYAIFGSTDTTVSLQNGWMLTSFGGKDDSKTAETISSVASLIGALAGSAKTAASGGATKAGSALTVQQGDQTGQQSPVLSPGLYEFEYDKGNLIGLRYIQRFVEGMTAEK